MVEVIGKDVGSATVAEWKDNAHNWLVYVFGVGGLHVYFIGYCNAAKNPDDPNHDDWLKAVHKISQKSPEAILQRAINVLFVDIFLIAISLKLLSW